MNLLLESDKYWNLQERLENADDELCSKCIHRGKCFQSPGVYRPREIRERCERGVEEIVNALEALKEVPNRAL